jgi:hypothetical protein
MQRLWIRCGLVLAGAILGAALGDDVAIARLGEGDWEVGGYVLNEHFSNSSGISDFLALGARGVYYIKAAHGVELEFDAGSGDSRDSSGPSFDVTRLAVGYIHNLTLKGKEKFTPLVMFNVGRINIDSGNDSSASTFVGAGGGVRYFYTPRVALRLDGRVYRWRGDGDVVPRTSYYSFDLMVGVSFAIGSAK